jgi:hypothetical protein
MFALRFSGNGLLALDKEPKACKMNNQYFCDVGLEEVQRSVIAITGKSGIEGLRHIGATWSLDDEEDAKSNAT